MITLLRRLAVVLVFLLAAPGAALADTYLPVALTDLTAAEKAVVANPAPVQLLFQFKSRGVPNYQATQFLNAAVFEHVSKSGVFSTVTSGPAPGGAVLSITLENIPEEGAFRQGFATGMTFGLAGNTVIDSYICTVEYIPGPDAAKVTKEVRHQIITTVGIKKQPLGTVRAISLDDAVLTMTRQVVTHGVNAVAKDAGFVLAAAPTPDAEAAAAPPAGTGRMDFVRQLAALDIAPLKLGAFAPGPKFPAGKDKAMGVRLMKAAAPGGSFAGFLRTTLEGELNAAGKLDPASGLEVTGFLVESELNSSADPANATVGARFVVKRDGTVVYDKVLRASDRWKAEFAGAVAIPDAINRYYALYDSLAQDLLRDPEFIAAAKR